MSEATKWIIYAVIGAVIGWFVIPEVTEWWSEYRTGNQPIVITTSAVSLYEEHQDNASRFNEKYEGKRVELFGMVGKIDDENVRLIVDEDSFATRGRVYPSLDLEDLPLDVRSKLEIGDRFEAVCAVGKNFIGDLRLHHCTVP